MQKIYQWLLVRGQVSIWSEASNVILELNPEGSAYCVLSLQDASEIARERISDSGSGTRRGPTRLREKLRRDRHFTQPAIVAGLAFHHCVAASDSLTEDGCTATAAEKKKQKSRRHWGRGAGKTQRHEEPDHVAEPRLGRPAKFAARPPVALALQPARCIATAASARLPGGSRPRGSGALGLGDAAGVAQAHSSLTTCPLVPPRRVSSAGRRQRALRSALCVLSGWTQFL